MNGKATMVCSVASDMWSFGVIMYELYVGRRLFDDSLPEEEIVALLCSVSTPSLLYYSTVALLSLFYCRSTVALLLLYCAAYNKHSLTALLVLGFSMSHLKVKGALELLGHPSGPLPSGLRGTSLLPLLLLP